MFQKNHAVLWLVAAALIWAGAGISIKHFSILGISFLVFFLVSRMFKFLAVWFVSYYRVKRHEPVKNLKEFLLIFLNACFSVGTPFFFFLALNETSVSNAYFLQYTMPAWVLVFAVMFLGEKISGKKIIGIVLTLAGLFFIASPNNGIAINLGLLFGLLSAFSHTGDIVTTRELKGYSYHTISFYTNLMQFMIAATVTPFFFGFLPADNNLPLLASIAGIGIMLGLASDLYYHALQKLEASTAAIISFSELVFAAVLAFIFFGESPEGNELFGYALVFVAGAIIILRKAELPFFDMLLRLTDKK